MIYAHVSRLNILVSYLQLSEILPILKRQLTSPASFSAAVERLGLRTGVSGGEGVTMEMFVGASGDLYVPKRYDSS